MAVRTNLVQNPKFQNNSNFWALDSEFTATHGTGGYLSGGKVRQVSASGYQNFTTVNDANGYAVAVSTDYVFSFYYRVDSITGNGPQIQINGTSAYGTTLAYISIGSTGGAWARADIAFNSGAHTLVYMRLFNNNGNVDITYSNFLLELDDGSGDALAYFDGDTTDTGSYAYAWTGTDDGSTSTETELFVRYTETFTIDGLVIAEGVTNTFTIDAIIEDPDDGTPASYLIYALMDVTPTSVGGTLKSDATFFTGYTRLTRAVNGLNGQVEWSRSLPSSFSFESDLYNNGTADAAYMYWGCSTTPTNEDDNFGGYVVAWDEYSSNKLQLRFAGSLLEEIVFPHSIGSGTRRVVRVIYDDTHIYIYVDNVLCIDYDDIARAYGGNLIGVGARTGGSNAEHRAYSVIAYEITTPWHPTVVTSGLNTLEVRSVDTMKWQKDLINNQPSVAQIQAVVNTLADHFDLTHIAIAIPFNTDADYAEVGIVPSPYMTITTLFQVWCDAIHARGLGVIFRGAFNETEVSDGGGNWNSILKVGVNRMDAGNASSSLSDGQTTYMGRLHDFIVNNATFFEDGDLFAPMPERTENNTFTRNISSITRSGQIATVTTSSNHDVRTGQPVSIAGATQSEYNGSFIMTKTADNEFTIEVVGSPATPATGSPVMTFGVSVFSDNTSWLTASGGVTTNFANFFNEMIAMADAAFLEIGKNVGTGYSSNNYSEIDSGWIPASLFSGAGKVVADHYGSTHEVLEMYTDVVDAVNNKGYPFYHQEWSDYWNGSEDDTVREDYLINFYNMLSQLVIEGDYRMLNYWGGWVFGVGEGILTSVGTLDEPEYDITWWGDLLAEYFGAGTPEAPVGVHDTEFGYFLNDVAIKTPSSFSREYIFQKTDYTMINGKTVRDTSSLKEKYMLTYDNLSKDQVDALLEIIALNAPVRFIVNARDVVNVNKICFPYIGAINYDTLGSNYLSDLQLELIVEEAD